MGWLRSIGLVGLLIVALPFGESAFAPAEALEKWGPFRGRVVDMATGQGIPGAVILAIWTELVPTPIEMHTRFYDAKEAVTGPDGSFEIPRRPPPFFTFQIREPEFKVFAPGYAEQQWVVSPPSGQQLIDPTVIEMRRLKTREERLEKLSFASQPSIPLEKRCLYTRALNAERKNLGFSTLYSECSP